MASTPIDFTKSLDTSSLKGKTALVTGGTSGIGRSLALALQAAGAKVTVVDINVSPSTSHTVENDEAQLNSIKCDVTSWESQVGAFKAAAQYGSTGTVDIVISAAGIRTQIAYVPRPTPDSEPTKPPTGTLDINLTGTYYTVALAAHYFALSPPDPAKQVLFISSMAAYNQSRAPFLTADYTAAKFGVRGLFHQYRRSELADTYFGGARFNCLAPFFIRTPMITDAEIQRFEEAGWSVGTLKDVEVAGMRCLADPDVRGRCVVVCKAEVEDGDRVFDCCDEFEGAFGVKEIAGRRSWFGKGAGAS
jgi:NAD(P)-dependent dehydrogenase (short-subunit alcohol dehydrogenase family)